jgi:hypothetical protein
MKRSATSQELLTKVELAVLAQRNLAQLEGEILESSELRVLRAGGAKRRPEKFARGWTKAAG